MPDAITPPPQPASARRATPASEDDLRRLLDRGVADVIPLSLLIEKLRQGERMRMYIGVDPTSPVIHIGHAVPLRKMRQFQDLGHEIVLLIGDFTGRIGDPTDKSAARVQLTHEQVLANAATYREQAAKILDFDSPDNPPVIDYNGRWWDPLAAKDMIELAASFTVQQMLAHETYAARIEANRPLGLHELLYPLLQGYDSVALDTDAEFGGTDQTFNMLAGRQLLRALKGKDKIVVTCPLLEGTDGRKMSKSYGNVIGVSDPPHDMYGRVMSLHDELIPRYFELATDVPDAELAEIRQQLESGAVNPMVLKKRLASEIVTAYHSAAAAEEAARRFEREVQHHEAPEELPDVVLEPRAWPIADLLVATRLVTGKNEARRLVQQGSVQLDGQRVTDPFAQVQVRDGSVLRARKRSFVRLRVTG
jgi:tyrosyl-tRNA synthetase